MTPRDPTISTGTTPAQGLDLRAAGIFSVTVTKRGQPITLSLAGWQPVGNPRTGRVTGIWREIVAKYLVLRDGNRCAIRSPFCIQGEQPFKRPAGADFDEIVWARPRNTRLDNLQLACHPCNAHHQQEQRVQWKRNRAASRTTLREGERTGEARSYGPQVDLNVQLFPVYVDWLDAAEKKTHGVPLEEAIYRAAREIREECGHGAWQTITGYLKTLTTGDDAPYYVDAKKKVVYRRPRK